METLKLLAEGKGDPDQPLFAQLLNELEHENGVHEDDIKVRYHILKLAGGKEVDDPIPWRRVAGRLWCAYNYEDAYTVDGMEDADYEDAVMSVADQLHPEVVKALLTFLYPHVIKEEEHFFCDYFAGMTLEGRYLLKNNKGRVCETPVRMYARVAAGAFLTHGEVTKQQKDLTVVTFKKMVRKLWTPATPSLSNGGRKKQQFSSCMLVPIGVGRSDDPDSMEAISQLTAQCMVLSARGAGIGFRPTVRGDNSLIHGSGGRSKGMVPLLRFLNGGRTYADQGGGKRNGAWAAYIEPHDADFLAVLDALRETKELARKGNDEKAHAILEGMKVAVWASDFFMQRVKDNKPWSFFSCDTAPGLDSVYGDEYAALYTKYEEEGRAVLTVSSAITDVWRVVLETQIETGFPYLLYKDQAQRASPQNHLGNILLSNLCAEILEVTEFKPEVAEELKLPSRRLSAMCNLASISLPAHVRSDEGSGEYFDFEDLMATVSVAVRFIHATHIATTYPDEFTKANNMATRPMAIGVQGLANVFFDLKLAWTDPKALELNRDIAETMLFAAMSESNLIAKEEGKSYPGFKGSALSKGVFHWMNYMSETSGRHDWGALREDILKYGIANSLFIGLMPTASTAQILGNPEAFAPLTKNIFARQTDIGSFTVVNHYLVEDLKEIGLWNTKMKNRIIKADGSIAKITEIPEELRALYMTAFEIPPKIHADMMLARQPFVDQTQSFNLFMVDDPEKPPLLRRLGTMHFYTWSKGAKTGMYYLRTLKAARREAVGLDDDSDSDGEMVISINESMSSSDNTPPSGDFCEPGCENCN